MYKISLVDLLLRVFIIPTSFWISRKVKWITFVVGNCIANVPRECYISNGRVYIWIETIKHIL